MSSGEPMADHTVGQREPSDPSRGSVANHDAVPAAIAVSDEDRTDKAATSHRRDRSGDTPVFDRSKPINDARLAALEELSALDQKLELEYGLVDNPLIKAQQHMAAKTDTSEPRTGAVGGPDPNSRKWNTPGHKPAKQPTLGECRLPQEGTLEPVAWWVRGCEYDTGCEYEFVALLKEQAELAATQGGKAVPLYRSPTLTSAEREAVEIAVEYVGSAFQVEHYAAVLRGLLDRLK